MATATKNAATSTKVLTTNKHLIRWVEKMVELHAAGCGPLD